MDAREIGKKIIEYCLRGENLRAVDELYAEDVVSVEPFGTPEAPAEIRGIEEVRSKNRWWVDTREVHAKNAEGPFTHNDRFAVKYHYDVTPKEGPMAGRRMKTDEIALYTVRDGKVVREEFFYD